MIYAELDRAAREADPLRYYRASGRAAEWVFRHFSELEIYNNAANKAGKTMVAAGIGATMARGRPSIPAFDGSPIALPTPERPVRILIGTPTYKLGAASILEALERCLGSDGWSVNSVKSVYRVRHERDPEDPALWTSELIVFPYDGPVPEAVRGDAWLADENPPLDWLHAIRNRGKAGRSLYGGIFATPIDASEWEPVKAEYPDQAEAGDVHGRARIQSSVYENRFLHVVGCPGRDSGAGECGCSCPNILQAEQANEGFADAPARLRGEFVNLTGGCPYDPSILRQWMNRCRPPLELAQFVVEGERDASGGLDTIALMVKLEVWRPREENDQYVVMLDVGRGIDDGKHDPDGIHVRSRRDRALVARANGVLGAWGAAMAAREIADYYGSAPIFVGRGGGYGETALSALRVAGYRNVGSELEASRVKQMRTQLGVTENGGTRIKAMQAVASMLQRGNVDVPSADVIRCFGNCIVDRDGKIVARPGYHDEDLVLMGHGNRLLDLMGPLPVYVTREKTSSEEFREQMARDGWNVMKPRTSSAARGPVDVARW